MTRIHATLVVSARFVFHRRFLAEHFLIKSSLLLREVCQPFLILRICVRLPTEWIIPTCWNKWLLLLRNLSQLQRSQGGGNATRPTWGEIWRSYRSLVKLKLGHWCLRSHRQIWLILPWKPVFVLNWLKFRLIVVIFQWESAVWRRRRCSVVNFNILVRTFKFLNNF